MCEIFRHFSSSIKTAKKTQPRLHGLSVAFLSSVECCLFDVISTKLPTLLVPNLVNRCWLLRISLGILVRNGEIFWLNNNMFYTRVTLVEERCTSNLFILFSLSCLCRRAASCADVDFNTQTRQLIRQYSVTTPQISPKRPFRLPRTSTFALVSARDQSASTLKLTFWRFLDFWNFEECFDSWIDI